MRSYVYNPLCYAVSPHRAYLRKYLRGPRQVLFLGMNPGPWGMMQTGILLVPSSTTYLIITLL